MAAKEKVWNVVVEEVPYKVTMVKNKISVNGGEPVKYTTLKKAVGEGKGSNYIVPLGNQNAILRVTNLGQVALTLDGKDCLTGEAYEPPKIPWWAWIHVVIHALGFFFLIGGAVGGAVQGGVICLMLAIASDNKKETAYKVGVCTAILAISLLAQFALACLIVGILI
ncbi:MAG: hypothetical protein E7268_07200 [Lachnospiraceae bacterium]|nr:hypothetical protein [Lachnospiraceae bacterium]